MFPDDQNPLPELEHDSPNGSVSFDQLNDDISMSSDESGENQDTFSGSNPIDKIFAEEGLGKLLHEYTDNTYGEFVFDILKLYRDFNISKACLERVVQLFKKHLPGESLAPSSLYKFMTLFDRLNVSTQKPEQKHFCSECHTPIQDVNEKKCPRCDSVKIAHLVSNDVGKTIKKLFELRGLAKAIDFYKLECENKIDNGLFVDVVSGNLCKNIEAKAKYDIQLIMNTDGFPAGNSSVKQVWPLFLSIANVHPRFRKEFLIIARIWFSQHKPSMTDFLDDWVENMVQLKNEGVEWTCFETNEVFRSKISVVAAVTDSHARAPIQNISLYNGEYGCSFCELKGELVGKAKRIYPFSIAESRTQSRMIQQALDLQKIQDEQDEALRKRKRGDPVIKKVDRVVGVKGPSSLCLLPDFDVVDSFSPDYLHSLLLGVVKRHLLMITNSKNKKEDYYIGGVINQISNKLESIKPPSFVNRLPRSLKTVKNWKASEFLNWLLYYSLPCLKNAFKKSIYLEHWCLLVEGIFILCKEEITRDEIVRANTLLRTFCLNETSLYGRMEETFNLHLLMHFANSVANLGPLWATSTFLFENANGMLKRKIHGRNSNVAMELTNTFKMIESLNFIGSALKRNMYQESSNRVMFLGKGKEELVSELLSTDSDLREINCDAASVKHFYRARYKGITYTSERYMRASKTCSHFVEYTNKDNGKSGFGKIIYFAIIAESKFVIAKKVEVFDTNDFLNKEYNFKVAHIKRFTVTEEQLCFKVESITKPLFCVSNYLCTVPNLIEINL